MKIQTLFLKRRRRFLNLCHQTLTLSWQDLLLVRTDILLKEKGTENIDIALFN